MLNKIKWAYQRVVRGYDDTLMWGLSDYFNQVLPEIERFCIEQLDDKELMKLNPKRKEIFLKTLELINNFKKMKYTNNFKHPNEVSKLWSFIGYNIAYFWD